MTVAIIDYGSGNLRSASKAFERAALEAGLDTKVTLTNKADDLAKATHIVLPGVGAFADCMAGLSALDGMIDALNDVVLNKGKPFLGICVGMQLLAATGKEHGDHKGLGWMAGDVVELTPSDRTLKIPHMGWNNLAMTNAGATHPVLDGMDHDADVYFVHSFHFKPTNRSVVLAEVDYGGPVTAIVGRDNIIGTQFHPEKSQRAGLHLITNFLNWKP